MKCKPKSWHWFFCLHRDKYSQVGMFHRLFCKYRLDCHFQSQSGSRPKKSPFSNHQIATVICSLHHVTRFFLFTYRIRIFFLHSHRRYPLLQIDLHILFSTYIYIFRIIKSVCNVRQWGFPIWTQTSDNFSAKAIVQTFSSPRCFDIFCTTPLIIPFVHCSFRHFQQTCPYEWPPLINYTMESLCPPDKSFDLSRHFISSCLFMFLVQRYWW